MDGALAWILGLVGSLIGGLSISSLLLGLLTARRIRRLEARLEARLDRLSRDLPSPAPDDSKIQGIKSPGPRRWYNRAKKTGRPE